MFERLDLNLKDGTARPFWHRGSQADLGVLAQIFRDQDYALSKMGRDAVFAALFSGLLREGKKPLILDAGANIGASALWFALNFPGSHILCYEPDPENFELLRRNTGGLDVDLNQAAVGSRDGAVSLLDTGGGAWAYRTRIEENGSCPMIGLGPALEAKIRQGFTPFIAKIDIEGGEAELFSADTQWVDRFPLLIIELHDGMLPGQGNSRNFLKCISQYDRDFVYVGENVFSVKNG